MNRKYNLNEFINRIEEIRRVREDLSITTDLIVGFPGETEEDFKETINTIKKIKFTKIHTFPYSKREGTPAAKMKDQIDGNIKKKRVREVLKLSKQLENDFYKQFINKTIDGVVEKHQNGNIVIHSSNFIPVIIKDRNLENGKILKVKILSVDEDNNVYGEIKMD